MQLVREPTRGAAPLDLLFTNREGLVGDVEAGGCLGQSDHNMVEFSILGGVRSKYSKTATLDFWRADFELFRRLVGRVLGRKIMEQIVLREITRHVQDNRGIRPSQHGFTKGRSCLTNLISSYDLVTHPVDEEKAVDVVYLDFSKAFDTVSHSILLQKLAVCGLDRYTLGWVRNWLEGCAQRVVVNGVMSSW